MQVHPQQYTQEGLLNSSQPQTQYVMQSPILQQPQYAQQQQQNQQTQYQQQYQQIPQNYGQSIPPQGIPAQLPLQSPIMQSNLTNMAMQNLNIPDQLNFEHRFEKVDPCCDGLWAEALILRDEYNRSCRCRYQRIPERLRRQPLGPEDGGFLGRNLHNFDVPDYILDNGLLEMEFWSKCGIVTLAGIPILKFQDSQLNMCDVGFAHWCSGYPKVAFHFLLEQAKPPIKIYPEPSICPEHICSSCPELAIFNVCKSERKFYVQGLIQGECTITNTRNCSDACARAFFLQGFCGCSNVDYPRFSVNFQNVLPVDKLAILLALVHYNIVKKWYTMGIVKRRLVGLG